jgi:hypothetical protein
VSDVKATRNARILAVVVLVLFTVMALSALLTR